MLDALLAAIDMADLGALSHLLTSDPEHATAGLVHLAIHPPPAPAETHFRMAQLLLLSGADPNHHEALYHAAEHPTHGVLDAILAAPRLEPPWLSYCLLRKLDFADLTGLEKMLQAGADPNLRSRQGDREMSLHHAIRRGRDSATLHLLLTRGARPDIINIHNHTARRQAIRFGRTELGSDAPESTPLDHWLFQLWHQAPSSPPPSPPGQQDFRLLADAAAMRNVDAVRNMLAAGFPAASPTHDNLQAIHFAAYHRDEVLAELLFAHGVSREEYMDSLDWLSASG
jgi:ankyrin repeat protein